MARPTVTYAGKLFDENPIRIGGFEFRAREAVAVGQPDVADWQAALDYAEASEYGSPYWVSDLFDYAQSREDWRSKLDQIQSRTGLARQTIHNRISIGRRVKGNARHLSPSISHSAIVASLEPAEQEELLEQAKAEEWTVSELARAKKERDRKPVLEGQAVEMHTIEVTVRMTREATSAYLAEQSAWQAVRSAIAGIQHAHVIAAHARPYIQAVRPAKRRKTA